MPQNPIDISAFDKTIAAPIKQGGLNLSAFDQPKKTGDPLKNAAPVEGVFKDEIAPKIPSGEQKLNPANLPAPKLNEAQVISLKEPMIQQGLAKLKENPHDADAKLQIAEGYRQNGVNRAAKFYYADVLKADPANTNAIDGLAYLSQSEKDNETALNLYKESIKINPENVNAINGAAFNAYKLGNIDEAKQFNDAVLNVAPDQPNALFTRSLIQAKEGKNVDAKESLDKAKEQWILAQQAPTLINQVYEDYKNQGGEDVFHKQPNPFTGTPVDAAATMIWEGGKNVIEGLERSKLPMLGEGFRDPEEYLNGTLQALQGGVELTFGAGMSTPGGMAFVAGMDAADKVTNGYASKVLMAPLESFLPKYESETAERLKSLGDVVLSLGVMHATMAPFKGAKEKVFRDAYKKYSDGKPLNGDELKTLSEGVWMQANPESFKKLREVNQGITDEKYAAQTIGRLAATKQSILDQMEGLTPEQKVEIAPLIEKRVQLEDAKAKTAIKAIQERHQRDISLIDADIAEILGRDEGKDARTVEEAGKQSGEDVKLAALKMRDELGLPLAPRDARVQAEVQSQGVESNVPELKTKTVIREENGVRTELPEPVREESLPIAESGEGDGIQFDLPKKETPPEVANASTEGDITKPSANIIAESDITNEPPVVSDVPVVEEVPKTEIDEAKKESEVSPAVPGAETIEGAKAVEEQPVPETIPAAEEPKPQEPVVEEKPADAPDTNAGTIQSEPGQQKYKIGKSPQTWTITEELKQTKEEKELGEQPVKVKNDKTGEEQVVLKTDLTKVKTRTEAAKGIADEIRKLKGKPLKLKDSEGNEINVVQSSFLDPFIELVASTVETGGKIADAIVDATKKLREEEWYKKLKRVERKEVMKEFHGMFEPHKAAFREALRTSVPELVKETTGVKKPVDKITVNERTALKDQIKMEAKASREGYRQARTEQRDFASRIKGILDSQQFAGKVSPAQYKAITKAAARVNTELRMDRFEQFAEKVLDDTNYAAKLADLNRSRRRLKSRDYGTLSGVAKEFLAINPASVPDALLPRYEQIINGLSQNRVPSAQELVRTYNEIKDALPVAEGDQPIVGKSFRELQDSISELAGKTFGTIEEYLAARKQLASLNRAMQQLVAEGRVTPEEADAAQALYLETGKGIEEHAAENLAAESERLKDEMIREGKMIASNQTLDEFTPEQRKYAEKFQAIQESILKQMPIEDADAYRKVMSGLDDGMINSKMYELLNKAGRIKAENEIKGEILDGAINRAKKTIKVLGEKTEIPAPEKALTALTTRGKYYWDQFFGLGDQKPIWKKVVTPIIRAYNQLQAESTVLRSKYHDAARKLSDVEKAKIAIVKTQIDYQNNKVKLEDKTTHDWADLEAKDKDYFKVIHDPANPMLGLNNVKPADMKTAQQAYAELPKDADGNLDTAAALAQLQGNEKTKAVLDAIDEVIGGLEDKVRISTEKRGDIYEPRNNYFPRFVRQAKPNYGLFNTEPATAAEAVEALLGKPTKNLTLRGGSTYARTDYRYYTSYNLDSIINRHIQDSLRDYHLSDPMRERLGSLGALMQSETGDRQAVARSLYDAMKDGVTTMFGLDNKATMSDIQFVEKAIAATRTMALARPLRLIQDFTANVIREALSSGSLNIGTHEAYKQLLDAGHSSLMFKAGKFAEERYITNKSKLSEIANKIIPMADTPITRGAFASAFNDQFKATTGTKFDPDRYVNSETYRDRYAEQIDDAISHAEARVSERFNAQTPLAGPSKTKWVPGGSAKEKYSVFSQLLGFLNSWNLNDTQNLLNKGQQLFDGSSGSRFDALRDLSGIVASNYVYTTVAIGIASTIKAGIAQAADKDEESFWKELGESFQSGFEDVTNSKTQGEIGVGTVLSLALGRYGNAFRMLYAGIAGIIGNGVKNNPQATAQLQTVTNAMQRSMFANPIKSDSKTVDLLRLVPAIGEIAAQGYGGASSITALTDQVHREGFESLSMGEKETWTALQAVNYLIGLTFPNPVSPELNSELQRAASAMVKEEKNDRMREVGSFELYQKLEDKELIPPIPQSRITIDGEPRQLSSEEYQEFSKLVEEKRKEEVSELLKDPDFKKLSDEEKAKQIKSSYRTGYNHAKEELFPSENE